MAIDYRLRYYLGIGPFEDSLACLGLHRGVERALLGGQFLGLDAFVAGLEQFLADVQPVGRGLSGEQEDRLNRYCLWLGCFEIGFRRSVEGTWPWVRLLADVGNVPVEHLLAYWPKPLVEDMRRLSWRFWETQQSLIEGPCVLYPAYLIADGCLLKFRTTIGKRAEPEWLYQLVEYVAFDYRDRSGTGELGIYLTRHGRLVRWSVEEFLGRASDGAIRSLRALKDHLQAQASQLLAERSPRERVFPSKRHEYLDEIQECLAYIFDRPDFEGTPDQYQWLEEHYGVTEEEDVRFAQALQYVYEGEAGLEDQKRGDPDVMGFLKDDEAVERFLQELLAKYDAAADVYPQADDETVLI